MRIWSVLSQKGGSGKTTLLLHAAIAAMGDDLVVSVIDLDPQRSAEQWSEYREARIGANQKLARRKGAKVSGDEPAVVHGTTQRLADMLEVARRTGTDLVLIDTPPAVDQNMIYAASSADLIIVPTRTGILDQFALRETLEYLRRMNALSKAVVVINAPGADAEARSAAEKIVTKEFGVPLVSAALLDHSELATSLREGKGVTEAGPRGKAAKTVRDIYKQLAEFDRQLIKTRARVPT